ncbi:MAG: site-2 protease family protein [Ktedonobacterales bacterium]
MQNDPNAPEQPSYPNYPQYAPYAPYSPAYGPGQAPPAAPLSGQPVYPPPPEYYEPQAAYPWMVAPPTPVALAPYPAYAPGGVIAPEHLHAPDTANPHVQRPSGRPEQIGCLSSAALIGLLSKLAIFAKVLLPLGSAIISFGVYALFFGGWQAGLGIVLLLFVHEMGHYVVIRAKGLRVGLPVFIPLLGAYVAMRSLPVNARDDAEIGIAGPVAGAAAGVVCLGLYYQSGQTIYLWLAYFSFFINLLNLLPVAPLDGARVTGAISKWIWPVGLVLVAVAFFYTYNIFLLVLGFLGLMQMFARFRSTPELNAYYKVPVLTRIYVTVLYFGLAGGLALATFATQNLLHVGGLF